MKCPYCAANLRQVKVKTCGDDEVDCFEEVFWECDCVPEDFDRIHLEENITFS